MKRVVCVEGDGGFYLNIQDLATIRGLGLPIKMFVLNNDGYASMRTSNEKWFGRKFGADEESGLHLPNLAPIVFGFGLSYALLSGHENLESQVRDVLRMNGPVVCEVPSPPYELRPPAPVSPSNWVPTPKFQ